MKGLVKTFGEPKVITTDRALALLCEFNKLREQGFYKYTAYYTIKYLKNLIVQDHRHIKRRLAEFAEFQSPSHASRILKETEKIHDI